MPIEIIQKRKTEPSRPDQHRQLVPLKVMGFERIPTNEQDAPRIDLKEFPSKPPTSSESR